MEKTNVALALIIILLAGACSLPGEAPSSVSPLPTSGFVRTEFLSPIYLPLVGKEAGLERRSPKKGLSIGQVSPEVALRHSSWYYGWYDHGYEDVEFVRYFDRPYLIDRVIEEELLVTGDFVMALNECNAAVFECPSIEEQVRLVIRLREYLGDDQVIVAPCPAGTTDAVQYLQTFWTIYTQLTGKGPDPALFRNCFHCYGDFVPCSYLVDTLANEMALYGLTESWVTELGAIPGMTRSYDRLIEENTRFLCWMEQNDSIERYAYWTSGFKYYGHWIPGRPGESWVPLNFQWQERDGSLTWKRTAMGDWWSTMPECDAQLD